MTVAFLDVHYQAAGARAACVVADTWEADAPTSVLVSDIEAVEAYEPGSFYRRKLPCLLSVLRLLPSLPDVIVVDGYVWLPPARWCRVSEPGRRDSGGAAPGRACPGARRARRSGLRRCARQEEPPPP